MDRNELFIGGRWTAPRGGGHTTVLEAASEQAIGIAAMADAGDIEVAVTAARDSLGGRWRDFSTGERAAALRNFGKALKARGRDTTALVSRENGMPITISKAANGFSPAMMFDYYADLVERRDESDVRPHFMGGRTVVRREPAGVVAAITPWNYPQALAAMKIAPALAAGCSVVFKPSPETALDAFVFADAAVEAGLPAGVLNVVPGGRETGARLVAHPGVDKVAFTGSTRAGREIGRVCGENFTPVTLELGGKSAAIVLDDVDMDVFTHGLLEYSFGNNGQTCHASTRVLVPRGRYAEFVEAITETVRGFVVGDPLEKSTQIGPLVSCEHRRRVLDHIASGRGAGARITTGGGVPADRDRGWFVEPTVFADVENSSRIAQEEIFGPVVCVLPYDSVDHAVDIANDSKYGLAGMVWTSDEARGMSVASRFRAGTVGVNIYGLDLDAPFGGRGASGIGRELGPEGLANYYALKSVYFPTPA
ncbi:aldehyde dehydrogenase [Nocardia sp. NPDC052254]|uniref:aldehyde dehydrogenase n=1 Tax=Nocardia sp. NPDC052254 TaxID=3155681 RepID=UPI00343D7233